MRHFTALIEQPASAAQEILRVSRELKRLWSQGARPRLLEGRVMTMMFEKPSLRTRISFEAAVAQLGGTSLFLNAAEAGLNGREAVSDVARVLGGYSDWIVMRTFAHRLIDEFVKHAHCPIVNGLSDEAHPCQALSDIFTIQEAMGSVSGKKLVFVGDGNNVSRSVAVACGLFGMAFTLAGPPGYEFPAEFWDLLQTTYPGVRFESVRDPRDAVRNADVVYTDVWTSMGQESEQEKRRKAFAAYQVNAELMALAQPHTRFLHCLPARRGLEVTDAVLDGPNSLVFPQAENRMHLSKGLLVWLLGLEKAV
jgi:ornithine carbamoyltransferase